MLRLQFPSATKAAGVALASLMLTLGATASYADNAQQLQLPHGAQASAPPAPRAIYAAPGTYADSYSNPSSAECIGGYRYINRIIDWNLSAAQNAVPVRC
jgi:hypothetical protein